MRYFAMMDGERKGPFTIEELIDAGVRPDTYVWSKEMVDWQRARYVADICRAFRQRLAGIPLYDSAPEAPEREKVAEAPEEVENLDDVPLSYQRIVKKSGTEVSKLPEVEPDLAQRPRGVLGLAVLATLLCFPVTGIIGIYCSVRSRKLWDDSETESGERRDTLRKESYAYNNMARMWTGITFFLGMIVYAFLFRFFL